MSEAQDRQGLFRRLEIAFETLLFGSRWLTLPIFVGFVVALVLLVFKFVEETWEAATHVAHMRAADLIVAILGLIDLSFAANLLIVVIFAGYENFVSRIHFDGHEDRPEWLSHIDFSALKRKLVVSIVAISAIDLLRRFMDIEDQNRETLLLLGGLQVLFLLSGVMLAAIDRIAGKAD